MDINQVPKYHVAPSFSISPVEAGGPLELGSIITDIKDADGAPLNGDCLVRVPHSKMFCSHQAGFTATRSRMTGGQYGIWAKLVGVDGVGCEASRAFQRTAEDVYHFRSVDTIYFSPSQKYMEESMDQNDVKQHVFGTRCEPVYMVTGLKTARGPSVRMSEGRKSNVTVNLGVQNPGGLPVELGPSISHSREARQEMGFEDSTDFIIGIRVTKLVYKKHLLTRVPKRLVAKEYNTGATVASCVKHGPDEVVDLGDDTGGEVEVEAEEIGDQTLETAWVVR